MGLLSERKIISFNIYRLWAIFISSICHLITRSTYHYGLLKKRWKIKKTLLTFSSLYLCSWCVISMKFPLSFLQIGYHSSFKLVYFQVPELSYSCILFILLPLPEIYLLPNHVQMFTHHVCVKGSPVPRIFTLIT